MGMVSSDRVGRVPESAKISAKIAVYSHKNGLEVLEVSASSPRSATTKLSGLVVEKVRSLRGNIPREALQEVIENLIHAEYEGVVVSILDEGNTVRVSDRGPGIKDKSRAFEFGFTGVSSKASGEIRGVGAGLGLASAAAKRAGGAVTIEDNIGGGTVVTISIPQQGHSHVADERKPEAANQRRYPDGVPRINLSERPQKVLMTVIEHGEVGPSTVAERLEISVSTAYRDLSVLEQHGLVESSESGKRRVTPLGRDFVKAIINTWIQ